MSKFTPGPWKYVVENTGGIWVKADDAHLYYIGDMEGSCPTCHANASLIAAAPDLLVACEEVQQSLLELGIFDNVPGIENTMLGRLNAAIAKAKGE